MTRLLYPSTAAILLCCLLFMSGIQANYAPIPCIDEWEEGAFPPKSMATMAVTCPTNVIVTLPNNSCLISLDLEEPTSDCEIISITNDFNGMATIPEQEFGATSIVIEWTVEDCNGVFTCSQFVLIQDTTAPTFVCPSSAMEECSVDDMTPFANIEELVAAGATLFDNCMLDSTYLEVGTPVVVDAGPCPIVYERAYTVRDTSGNTAMCMQTILVQDMTAPEFTCPANIVVNTDENACTATIEVPSIEVFDNCGDVTETNTLAPSGTIVNLPMGNTTIKYYAEDACGNKDSCETIITVVDQVAPELICADNMSTDCESDDIPVFADFAAFMAQNGSATDNCGMINESSFEFVSESSDLNACPETVTRLYRIADTSGNYDTCMHIITVSETVVPMFTVPLDTIINCGTPLDTMTLGAPTNISDNCNSAAVEINYTDEITAGTCPTVQSIERSWTATDACGNSSPVQIQTITIQDTIAPTAVCKLDTVYLDMDGNAISIPENLDGGSFDDCEGALAFTSDFGFISCNDASLLQNITLTVTDACGNTSTCMTSVLVLDTLPATLTCPPSISVNCPSNIPPAYTTYHDFENDGGEFDDNCQPGTPISFEMINEMQSGATCPYDVVRIYEAMDNNGNSDTCSHTITVSDIVPPSIVCPMDITITGTMNTCDTLLNIPLVTATDECGIASITNSFNIGGADASGTFPGGETEVTFTATDNCGNTSTCVLNITVDVDPAMSCPADVTVQCNISEEPIFTSFKQFMDAGGTANLGCGVDTSGFAFVEDIILSTDNCTRVIERTYSLPGMGESFECSYIITATDEIDPEIMCEAPININAELDQCSANVTLNPIATDNCGSVTITNDFTISNSADFPVGSTMVTFTATDDCGNTATCSVTVTVNDAQAPDITCPDGELAMCDASSVATYLTLTEFEAAGGTVGDNCMVDPSTFTFEGESTMTIFGMTFVIREYSIKDVAGNASLCTQTILVADNTSPTVTCPDNILVDADPGLCTADISGLIATVGDNCMVETIYNDYTGDGADASGIYPVGVTTVTFTIEDEEGNSDSCSFTVTVEDKILPNISCPPMAIGECTVSEPIIYTSFRAFEDAGGSASDVCGIDTTTFTWVEDESNNMTCPETITRTYSIKDNNGNKGTCVQTITIEDNTPPTISCPSTMVLSNDVGLCSAVVDIEVTASDLCNQVVDITNDFDSSLDGVIDTFLPVGETVIIFTATDVCGLSSTCELSITVNDNEAPVISFSSDPAAMDTVRAMCGLTEVDEFTNLDEFIAAGGLVTDNCKVEPTSFIYLEDILIIGSDPTTYQRLYEVADSTGNLDTAIQIVIVNDTEVPTITAPSDITVSCETDISDLTITGNAIANDNCSPIDLTTTYEDQATGLTCPTDSLITRTFTVTDSNGNTATDVQHITKQDEDAPVFDVNANLTSDIPVIVEDTIACNQDFPMPINASAMDACGVAYITVDTLPYVPNCAGYQVSYRYIASDICMNMDTVYSAFFVAKDTTAPMVTHLDTFVYLSTDPDKCEALATMPIPTVMDNCNNYTIVNSIDGEDTLTYSFPLGEMTFSYTITDDCGNMTIVDQTVTVKDDQVPDVECNSSLVQISLSTDMSLVYASSFYESASDACGSVDVKVRRLNDLCGIADNSTLGDSLFFCCEDIGQIHEIEVVVTDGSGNQNTCIALAEVSDKKSPEFLIPVPDVTVSCEYPIDLDDLSEFGTFVLTGEDREEIIIDDEVYVSTDGFVGLDGVYKESCPGATVTTTIVDQTVNNQGCIFRTFTITDASDNEATYTQKICIEDLHPFIEDNITWPADIDIEGCETDTPTVEQGGVPTFANVNKCHDIQYTYTDLVFDNPTSGCVYIRRTFKVVDTYIYDPNVDPTLGVWTKIQNIFMTNSKAPEFVNNCDDELICAQGTGCSALVNLTATATDDCTNEEDLIYSYTIDVNNDGSDEISGVGNTISEMMEQGIHKIVFTVSDRCGNTADCVKIIEVKECKPPTAVCLALAIDLALIDGTAEIWASDFNASSTDNCTDAENLIYSFSSNTSDFGLSFDCDDLGLNTVEMWVTDEAGNQSFCVTTVDVQDNLNACTDNQNQSSTILGYVSTQNNIPLANTTIEIDGAEMNMDITTDEAGRYIFQDIPMYNDYMITPSKNDDYLKGVSTLDLVLIQRHIIGFTEFTSPYDIIAADVNNSQTISAADVIELRKLILGVQDEFTNNESFRFVESNFHIYDTEEPFPFQEEIEFSEIDTSMMQSDFIAIKIGDVNGSLEEELGANAIVKSRANNAMVINTKDQYLNAGETVIVPIYSNIKSLTGLQYTIDYDGDYLEYISAEGGQITLDNSQVADHTRDDKTSIAWSSHIPVTTLNSKDPIAYFAYKVKKDGKLSNVWSISSEVTEAKAYDAELVSYDIELLFDKVVSPGFAMFQNQPNPFNDYTEIIFELPNASDVTLQVFDNAGKLVLKQSGNYSQGKHRIRLNTDQLTKSGIYYYKLKAGKYSEVRKMLKIQ